MLLTGTFRRSVDDKQRVGIPRRLRMGLTTAEPTVLYLAPGTDGSLALYSEAEFARLGERLAAASPTGPNVRAFSRLFYAQAQPVEVDAQGRIRVPPELAELAKITSEVVLVGVRDHLELWNPTSWDQYCEQRQPNYDEIAERALGTTEG